MGWTINYSKTAIKQLKKLDKSIAGRIMDFMDAINDPWAHGKTLKGSLREYWRYRVGDYRIKCKIKRKELIILVVEIDNRKDIYK